MFQIRIGLLVILWLSPLHAQDEDGLQKLLGEQMRSRAEATQVAVKLDGEETPAKLHEKPVFRYSDVPRRIEDATLWVWMRDQRPVALQKIEAANARKRPTWTHCFASLTDDLVVAKWPDGQTFETTKPGVTFTELKDGPRPAATDKARRLQLRDLVRRFSVTITNDLKKNVKEELRLLPSPVVTYGAEGTPVDAGSVFGFAASGTNPDAYLLLELRPANGDSPRWHYGWVRMTTGGLSARLDDNEVWTAPFVPPNPKGFETWTFFFVPRE
jgi:hypothetical protein